MNKIMLKLVWGMIITVGMSLGLHAQDQTVSGNLTVTGTADIVGNNFSMGTLTGTSTDPGWQMGYTDGTTSSLNFQATRAANVWKWWQNGIGTAQLQMTLDNNNTLTLFNSSGTAEITLSPTGTSTFANSLTANGSDNQMPNQTLTGTGSVLTEGLADARYISSAPASLSVFPGASATGADSMALGNSTVASGPYSLATGYYSMASGTYSTSMGYDNSASGNAAMALGNSNTASGDQALAAGYLSVASGWASVALSMQAQATGTFAIALGHGAIASDFTSVALGQATASGPYGIAIGSGNIASGYASTAIGANNTSSNTGSTALGYGTNAVGGSSTAMGQGTCAYTYASTAIGQYNVISGLYPSTWLSTDPLFEIGNGTDASHLSDALIVYKNGNATLQGTFTAPTMTVTGSGGFMTTPTSVSTTDIPMFGH